MGRDPKNGFKLVDCDGHILEPLDIWDRYVDREHREAAYQACSVYNHPDGGASAWINGVLGPKGMQGGGTFGIPPGEAAKRTWAPEDLCLGGFDPHARVQQQMDPGGIEAVIIFGSLGNVMNGVRDGEMLSLLCRGYNDWVSDEYSGPYPGRMFPMGYLPWQNVPLAIQELRRVAAKGFRGLKLPAKRRLHDKAVHTPDMAPLWAEAQEAELVLAIHPSVHWDNLPEMADVLVHDQSSLPSSQGILSPLNGIVSLTHLIYGGVLDRFPRLKVCVVECNGGWLPFLLDRLDRQYKFAPKNFPGVTTLPSETFRRQCGVCFMAEESTLPLFAEEYQDQILWGTDYPHLDAESTDEIWERLSSVREPVQQKILRDNAIKLFNLPLAVGKN